MTNVHETATAQRNQPWIRDELILALDLYMTNPRSPPSHGSREVGELSEILNRLAKLLGADPTETYRNANGVYMKMMNFRRFDPDFVNSGYTGLTRGTSLRPKFGRSSLVTSPASHLPLRQFARR